MCPIFCHFQASRFYRIFSSKTEEIAKCFAESFNEVIQQLRTDLVGLKSIIIMTTNAFKYFANKQRYFNKIDYLNEVQAMFIVLRINFVLDEMTLTLD